MARPAKQTVDYFPHYCAHKKTMFILEQKYGNDGYAFWFKLLEMIGSTDGHVLHLDNPADWEFLQAKTHLGDSFCTEILNLLASLDAIDKELWEQKTVWSDHFVQNIADVYKNRRVEMPAKPSFYRQKPPQDDVSTDRNPQSKLKETKLNQSKVNTELSHDNSLSTNNAICPHTEIRNLYNEVCISLPKVKEMTKTRQDTMRVWWKTGLTMDKLREFFETVQGSDFLTNREGKFSSCSFDWITKPANRQKILEGNYDNRKEDKHGRYTATADEWANQPDTL